MKQSEKAIDVKRLEKSILDQIDEVVMSLMGIKIDVRNEDYSAKALKVMQRNLDSIQDGCNYILIDRWEEDAS